MTKQETVRRQSASGGRCSGEQVDSRLSDRVPGCKSKFCWRNRGRFSRRLFRRLSAPSKLLAGREVSLAFVNVNRCQAGLNLYVRRHRPAEKNVYQRQPEEQ